MRLSAGFLLVPMLALVGCGEARGNVPDTSNDLHCSVLAFYFSGLAEHDGAPADQRRALAVVHMWYAAKVREIAAQRADPDSLRAEAEPILDKVKSDPGAMADEAQACSARAVAEPAFDRFVSSLP